jgi:hypothetical protein
MSSIFRFFPTLPLLLVLAAAAPAQAPDLQPVPLPLGVASPDGQTGFVRNRTGGIDAIDLSNGALLWSSAEAVRPFLCDRRLLAQAPAQDGEAPIRLVLLDPTQKGKLAWRSEPFALPEGWPTADGEGAAFGGRALVQDGKTQFEWRSQHWYVGGPKPPPGMVLRGSKTGRALVNLDTGKITALPDGQEKPPPALAAVKSAQYHDGVDQRTEPFRRGSRLMALEARDGFALVRTAWRLADGKLDDERVLLPGGAGQFFPYLLPGSRYLAVLVQNPREGWWVFDLETGQALARELPLGNAVSDLTVAGGRLFYLEQGQLEMNQMETPRTLHCVALPTGRQLWQRPVAGVPFYLPRP